MPILAHGVDIVEVSRIEEMLADHGDKFLTRCFTSDEQAYAQGKHRRAEHLAARFAAKEAVLKALGTGLDQGMSWTEIEVRRLPSGEPNIRLHGQANTIAYQRGITRWFITLSHTSSFAVASVIAWGEDRRMY